MKAKKCTICSKPVVEKYTPFCSPRCATIDLGNWLGEGYRIASEDEPDNELVGDHGEEA